MLSTGKTKRLSAPYLASINQYCRPWLLACTCHGISKYSSVTHVTLWTCPEQLCYSCHSLDMCPCPCYKMTSFQPTYRYQLRHTCAVRRCACTLQARPGCSAWVQTSDWLSMTYRAVLQPTQDCGPSASGSAYHQAAVAGQVHCVLHRPCHITATAVQRHCCWWQVGHLC